MHADEPDSSACPGCGSVLALGGTPDAVHPGASPSCSRLFEVTLRGLRDDTAADPTAAGTVALADAAYDAQHPVDGDPDRLRAALDRLGDDVPPVTSRPPVWRMTVADVAADLDVIDLRVLVESWARGVRDDWMAGADEVTPTSGK
jgi:Family of unknown function (DUF5946)